MNYRFVIGTFCLIFLLVFSSIIVLNGGAETVNFTQDIADPEGDVESEEHPSS